MTARERLALSRQWQALVARHGVQRATDIAAATWPYHWREFLPTVRDRAAQIERLRHERRNLRMLAERARRQLIRTAWHRSTKTWTVTRVVACGPHGLDIVRRERLPEAHTYGEAPEVRRRQHAAVIRAYFVRRGTAERVIGAIDLISAMRGRWLEVLRGSGAYDPGRYQRSLVEQRARRLGQRRARDGALIGWRVWTRCGDTLVSPHVQVAWDGPVLVATNWSTVRAVRGHGGIHAIIRHAPQYESRYGEIRIAGAPPSPHVVYGRVRGYGEYVLGTTGWRAQRVMIDLLVVHPGTPEEDVRGLERRYQCRVIVAARRSNPTTTTEESHHANR